MYSQHPLSAKLPPMKSDRFREVVEDIRENGLRHPIILFEGMVLDGWHRLCACNEAKVSPSFVKYTGTKPKALVKSENLFRRDLEAGQRAIIVVEIDEWQPAGKPTASSPLRPVTLSTDKVSTNAEMAAEAQVSESTIARAKVVVANGSEAVKEAVREGDVSVAEAAKAVKSTSKRGQMKALKAAREKPAEEPKAAPKPTKVKTPKAETIKKSEYDALVKEHKKLIDLYNALQENRDELAFELEATETVALKGDAAAIKIKQLQIELRVCERTRDEAMTKNVDFAKQCEWWKKQAVKLGWKPDLIKKK